MLLCATKGQTFGCAAGHGSQRQQRRQRGRVAASSPPTIPRSARRVRMSHRDRVDNPGTVSGRRSLALPTEVPRSCDRYRMTCQRTRTPLAQALLHQEIPGLRSRRRHSCTDHSVARVCASAIVPRSYRVSHMLGSGSPHPVLTPTPPVIPAVASLQSRDASRRCRLATACMTGGVGVSTGCGDPLPNMCDTR